MTQTDFLKGILQQRPSGTLHHYTNQMGLLGIVNNAEIWATHTQYLNDRNEFHHATKLVKQVLYSSVNKHPLISEILKKFESSWDDVGDVNVCVCSFSESYDSLPQWRAYTNSTSGFSLCFDGDFIREVADKNQFYLVPCIYQEKEQIELLEALIEHVIIEYETEVESGVTDSYGGPFITSMFRRYMYRFAPILKDISFQDEKEWRIITRPMPCTMDRYDYRVGPSMIVPYYKIPLQTDDSEFMLKSILVGPTPHPDRSMKSVRSLLVSKRLNDVDVEITSVPYRSW